MSEFILKQINDGTFPIGAYAHSYGLETYIQKGIVNDEKSAEKYIKSYIWNSLLYNDLLAVKLAAAYAKEGNLDGVFNIADILRSSRSPRESREGSMKLGTRFMKLMASIGVGNLFFMEFCDLADGKVAYPVAYGVFCGSGGFDTRESLEYFLYAQVSAITTNCVKSVPLSQTSGQKILYGISKIYDSVMLELESLSEVELCRCSPAFDIRGMQHESLYSRLYMS